MAEQGRREVVSDQLAFNAREQAPERSLATMGVRNPGQSGGPTRSASRAMEGLMGALGGLVDSMNDDLITQGKMDQMTGLSEQAALERGGSLGQQGWQSLDTIDKSNNWFMQKMTDMQPGGQDETLDPAAYKQKLNAEREEYFKGLPDDPAIRKLAVAAWDDKGPQLVAKQFEAHTAYNEGQQFNKLSSALYSGSAANADATRVMPGSTLRVSPSRVDAAIMGTGSDREIGILTMLGEAGGEGDVGMAAVAHVIKNRVTDKRWGGTVASVAKADKQFSVWNDGGANLAKYKGTAAYERAGQVYDAVMGGYTVDMTNGATHYFAPKGMEGGKDPDWFATESKRAGGGIKIGNHVFAGKSGMGGYTPEQTVQADVLAQVPMSPGSLVFQHKGQEGIDPGFAGILKETSSFLGQPLKILSGYRDPNHPVEAAKAAPGEHSHKDAVDIDMTGMSDEQRKALVQDLRGRGVKRFIAYSKSPNMLHIDMNSKQVSPDDWFMFDKSNRNLGNAPEWFKQVAQQQAGSSKTVEAIGQVTGTQVSSMLDAAHIRPALKVSALVDAIRRQMQDGSDQLFNDTGGIGKLQEMGAKPQEIDEVIRAKEAMEKKALDGYDTAYERARSDLLTRVKNGEFKNVDDVISYVDDMHKNRKMNDAQAQSLVRTAEAEYEKARQGEDAVIPKGFMEDTSVIYRKIDQGLLSSSEGYDAIAEVGKRYNLDPKTSQRFLAKVYSVQDSAYARDRSAAEAAQKKMDKDNDLKSRTLAVIAADGGGAMIPSGSVEVNGRSRTTTQFAIDELKKSIAQPLMDRLNQNDRGLTEEDATQMLYTNLYRKLATNDIVDEEGMGAFQAALRNGVIDPVTKKPREGAVTAVQTYINMKNDPQISNGYLARSWSDPKVRSFLEQTLDLYEMNLDIGTAMVKAEENIANGKDPKNITTNYRPDIESKVDTAINTAIGNNGWLANTFIGRFTNGTDEDFASKLRDTEQRNIAKAYIMNRADKWDNLTPGQKPEVSIELAMQDFENDAVQVNGQFIIGDHQRGRRIDQKMFVSSDGTPLQFGKEAVQGAVDYALATYGKSLWPEFWGKGEYRADKIVPNVGLRSRPNVYVTYNPDSGTVGLQLHDNNGKPVGKFHAISAKDMGDDYRKAYLEKPGMFATGYDAFADFLTKGGLGDAIDASFGQVR